MQSQQAQCRVEPAADEGREIFFELLTTADIFVDGFAGDACDKLGIGYTAQREIKPDIIYCQANGFGTRGSTARSRCTAT